MAKKEVTMTSGTIETAKIQATHQKIRKISEEYGKVRTRVEEITQTVRDNWVGEARDEFDDQYKSLIRKIEDFGDTLLDIYNALVDAEAAYTTSDDTQRKDYVKITEGMK